MADFLKRLSTLKINNRVSVALSGDSGRLRILPEISKASMCPGVYVDTYNYDDGTTVICNIWDLDVKRARMSFSNISYHLIYLGTKVDNEKDVSKYLANRILGATVIVLCSCAPPEHIVSACRKVEARLLVLKDMFRPFLSDLLKMEYENRLQKATEGLLLEMQQ
jgi:hypothetical protein